MEALATRLPKAFSTTWPASKISASGGGVDGSRTGRVSFAPVKGASGASAGFDFGPGVAQPINPRQTAANGSLILDAHGKALVRESARATGPAVDSPTGSDGRSTKRRATAEGRAPTGCCAADARTFFHEW